MGWGSLLWEGGRAFDDQRGPWHSDGPTLKIEFSRVSESRHGALTLVMDDQCGVPATVAWCLSKRAKIQDAICDLRNREGTTFENIGSVVLSEYRDPPADPPTQSDSIVVWARQRGIDGVV